MLFLHQGRMAALYSDEYTSSESRQSAEQEAKCEDIKYAVKNR
jgi:hypothetical protein